MPAKFSPSLNLSALFLNANGSVPGAPVAQAFVDAMTAAFGVVPAPQAALMSVQFDTDVPNGIEETKSADGLRTAVRIDAQILDGLTPPGRNADNSFFPSVDMTPEAKAGYLAAYSAAGMIVDAMQASDGFDRYMAAVAPVLRSFAELTGQPSGYRGDVAMATLKEVRIDNSRVSSGERRDAELAYAASAFLTPAAGDAVADGDMVTFARHAIAVHLTGGGTEISMFNVIHEGEFAHAASKTADVGQRMVEGLRAARDADGAAHIDSPASAYGKALGVNLATFPDAMLPTLVADASASLASAASAAPKTAGWVR